MACNGSYTPMKGRSTQNKCLRTRSDRLRLCAIADIVLLWGLGVPRIRWKVQQIVAEICSSLHSPSRRRSIVRIIILHNLYIIEFSIMSASLSFCMIYSPGVLWRSIKCFFFNCAIASVSSWMALILYYISGQDRVWSKADGSLALH